MSDVKSIKVKLKIDGEERHATQVTITAAIGDYPNVTVLHHISKEASEKSIKLSSGDVTKDMGKRQKKIFTQRNTADLELEVDDGNQGAVFFKGLISSPRYTFSSYNVAMSDVALPEWARIDALDYSCYTPFKTDIEVTTKTPALSDFKDIPSYIVACGKELQKKWRNGKDALKEYPDVQLASAEAQDQLNDQVMSIFETLMTNSSSSFGWKDLISWLKFKNQVPDDTALLGRVNSILRSASGSFISTIGRLAEEFQCIYVPGLADIGALKNKTEVFEDVTSYEAKIRNMNINAGAQGMFPIRYVAVVAALEDGTDIERKTSTRYVAYPPSAQEAGGSCIPITGPAWLPGYLARKSLDKEGKRKQKTSLSFDHLDTELIEKVMGYKDYSDQSAVILQEWGKCAYKWLALGGTTVQLNVPLDLGVELGRRMEVKNVEGESLFTGLLAQVMHNISAGGNGQQPDASTDLLFTHVELPGFTLP